MSAKTINFNGYTIANVHIEDKEMVITDYDKRRLFGIHLYIAFTLKRFDFLETHHKMDSEIRYPLRSSDVMLLIKEGFKFNSSH